MNEAALNRCKNITTEVIEQPLNSYWRQVKLDDDILPNYTKIIEKPIGLDDIRKNLDTGVYKTTAEWYNDMLLVWENGMKYHNPETDYHKIAKYCLASFKQKAHNYDSIAEWYTALNAQYKKLTEKISQSPVPQIVDPLVISSINESETIPPPSVTVLPDFVQKINKLIDDESCRRDIINILNKTEPSIKIEGEKFTIDVDDLLKRNSKALSALILYTNARG